MKARKRNSNDDWKEVECILLKGSCVITKADQIEFDVPANSASTEEQHWQDVRERAAIAAMHGLINTFSLNTEEEQIAICAVKQADALIEQLKEK